MVVVVIVLILPWRLFKVLSFCAAAIKGILTSLKLKMLRPRRLAFFKQVEEIKIKTLRILL